MPHPVCPLLHLPVFCIWRTLTVIFIFFAQLLDHITFVDTPGVLSGEKQRTQRSYDFTGVTSWFAAKCDLILLLFDPHKLDISDEFKRVIGSLRGHDDKIRIVLNKADQVDAQQVNEPAYCHAFL
jgi:predicted GTPase